MQDRIFYRIIIIFAPTSKRLNLFDHTYHPIVAAINLQNLLNG